MTKVKTFTVGLPVANLNSAVEWYRRLLGEVEELSPARGVWEFQIVPSGWLQLFESEINEPTQSVVRFESHDIDASRMLASPLLMLTKLKLFQEPLGILTSGIHLVTDCLFMNCWRNHLPARASLRAILPISQILNLLASR